MFSDDCDLYICSRILMACFHLEYSVLLASLAERFSDKDDCSLLHLDLTFTSNKDKSHLHPGLLCPVLKK